MRIDYLTNASVHLAVTDAEGARGAAGDIRRCRGDTGRYREITLALTLALTLRGAADLFVLGLPCNTSCTSSHLAPSRVSLLLWAAIAGVALCCATQLYGWLHRVCLTLTLTLAAALTLALSLTLTLPRTLTLNLTLTLTRCVRRRRTG